MPAHRKPTTLLELSGALRKNPNRRRGGEPEFGGEATCPRHLDREARQEWRRCAPGLRRLGLLTSVDRAAFAAYCACYSLALKAQRDIKEHGIILSGAKKNPACTVLKDALQLMRQYGGEFGLSPASRSKVNMPTAPPGTNPFDEFKEDTAEKYFSN